MKTVQLAKDGDSGNGGCPSVHLAEDGMAVVQAPEVDADTFAPPEPCIALRRCA